MSIDGYATTPLASRYLQQLCKHWGHRYITTFDGTRGSVDFGDGSTLRLEAGSTTLVIRIDCGEAAADTMRGIVQEHLDRFANREGLVITWNPPPS